MENSDDAGDHEDDQVELSGMTFTQIQLKTSQIYS